jgi:hypothetical protein
MKTNLIISRFKNAYTLVILAVIFVPAIRCNEEQIEPLPLVVSGPCGYAASFYLDSAIRVDETKATVWAHINYDSILIIEHRSITLWEYVEQDYWAGENPIGDVIQSLPDTLDFRKLGNSRMHCSGRLEWIYKYSFQVLNLKKGTDYFIELENLYTEKGQPRISIEYSYNF